MYGKCVRSIRAGPRDLKSETQMPRRSEFRFDTRYPIGGIPRVKNSRPFFHCSAAPKGLNTQSSDLSLRLKPIHENCRHVNAARAILEYLRLIEESSDGGARRFPCASETLPPCKTAAGAKRTVIVDERE